jgi:hypothetical protein
VGNVTLQCNDVIGLPGSNKRRFRFFAFLTEEARAVFGPDIFPNGIVPITNIVPCNCGNPELGDFYLIYHEEMTPLEVERLLHKIAERFKSPVVEVEMQMMEKRIPLRACMVEATGTDTLVWFL